MATNKSNIFAQIPKQLKEELFEELISTDTLKIQRIVSYGHTTQEFQWYDQDNEEWVILLEGSASVPLLSLATVKAMSAMVLGKREKCLKRSEKVWKKQKRIWSIYPWLKGRYPIW